jgi:4-amino-4-deoxy-L-arabinose transferase-like glycosyltransferase
MNALVPLVVVVNAMILVLGGTVTHLTLRASRRTGSLALRRLAVGFGIVTAGAVVGGALHQVVGTDALTAVFAQSLVTVLGFAVIAYSLYAETAEPRVRRVA